MRELLLELTDLQNLFISGRIYLPESMTKLTNLKVIGLSKHQIASFSKFGSELPNLQKILIYKGSYRKWGWNFWLHKYPYTKLSHLSKFNKEDKNFLTKLQNKGCKILIKN